MIENSPFHLPPLRKARQFWKTCGSKSSREGRETTRKGTKRIQPNETCSPKRTASKPDSTNEAHLERLRVTKSFRISPDQQSGRGVPGGWFRTVEGPPRGNY